MTYKGWRVVKPQHNQSLFLWVRVLFRVNYSCWRESYENWKKLSCVGGGVCWYFYLGGSGANSEFKLMKFSADTILKKKKKKFQTKGFDTSCNRHCSLLYMHMIWATAFALKAPSRFVADDILNFFFFFFRENKSWQFMWIVCWADNSHEMSRLVFSEK